MMALLLHELEKVILNAEEAEGENKRGVKGSTPHVDEAKEYVFFTRKTRFLKTLHFWCCTHVDTTWRGIRVQFGQPIMGTLTKIDGLPGSQTRTTGARLRLLQTLTTHPLARRDNTLTLLTFNLNTQPPLLPIQSHVLGNMKLSHVLSNHLSPILLRPTSTPPCTLYIQPLAPPHWGVCTPSLHMSKPSQSHFPQLVHHRGHSHLLPNNLIPNLIAPSVPTHPSQHPHLLEHAFLNTYAFLDRQHSAPYNKAGLTTTL
ncbi:hypothetical protein H5410_045176 [Solanum commersonii]|uniref:Uncharacterized protein n=1 Tax=Solanum commersonii TaxID=4109 RepID=A0A9J5XBX0_SOLCO|nr:hypothetical protein H5410_045176 [Solanum commersonii]